MDSVRKGFRDECGRRRKWILSRSVHRKLSLSRGAHAPSQEKNNNTNLSGQGQKQHLHRAPGLELPELKVKSKNPKKVHQENECLLHFCVINNWNLF